MVSRVEHRPQVAVWAVGLADSIPVLPVPLLEPEGDAWIDLARAVSEVYSRGANAAQINYRDPAPAPSLNAAEPSWVDELLRPLRKDGSTEAGH